MTTPPTSVREGVVRGLKIVAGTFATSVPVYFLAQLLFTRELAMALGLASALGASSALQARTRSEERRVGKDGRARWAPEHSKKKASTSEDSSEELGHVLENINNIYL